MRAEPDDQTPDERDEREGGVSVAWRILTAPRVLLALTAVLGLLLTWAQRVPQRPDPGELARAAPFAESEALAMLGLDDALVAWPVLLVGMFIVLVGLGLVITRRRRPVAPSPRRGWAKEALVTAVVGVVALLLALVIGRSNGLDARFELDRNNPGDPATVAVRDGDLLIPRALPLALRCGRVDPMDPTRKAACSLATGTAPGAPAEELVLAPGQTTTTDVGLTLTPLYEAPRAYRDNEVLELVVRKTPDASPERLLLKPGQPVALQASGHQLQMFPGPDGPLVLVTRAGQPPALLAPPTAATPAQPPTGLVLEVVPPTRQVIAARTEPERLLTILGVVFLVFGVLVYARSRWVPAPPVGFVSGRPEALATLALTLAGLTLGMLADASATPPILLSVGAIVALGTRPGLVMSALALVAGLGTVPNPGAAFVFSSGLVGALLAGAALGFLGRELATPPAALAAGRPLRVVLAALGLALAFLVPDATALLAGVDGLPLMAPAELVDPATGIRQTTTMALRVMHDQPLADLETLALFLAGLTAIGALVAAALRREADEVLAWVARGTAIVAGIVVLAAIGEALFGSVALDAERLRRDLSLAGPASLLDLTPPPEAALRLWSRAGVDVLRLVAALILAVSTFQRHNTTAQPTTTTTRWLPFALVAAALGLLFAAPPLALGGGLALGLGAWIVANTDPRGELVVRLALLLAFVFWSWGALAPPA